MAKHEFDMTLYELQVGIAKTLANPLRLAILNVLKGGEKTVNELAETVGVSQSNVSQHLALMRQRQIVKTRRVGSNIYYRLSSPKISQACDLIREVLLEQLSEKQAVAETFM